MLPDPFYRDYTITLFCGYSEEILPRLLPVFDIVFADPPYNLDKKYGSGAVRDKRPDYEAWCADWIKKCWRLLKPTGSFYLKTLDRHLEFKLPLMRQHGIYLNIIKWWNVAASHSKRCFWHATEPIILYAATEDYYFNTYAEENPVKNEYWAKERDGRNKYQMKDVWHDIPLIYSGSVIHPEAILRDEAVNKQKAHPTQMPLKLAARALKFSCPPDGYVLDPFCGSGTMMEAAMILERHCTGIEVDRENCEMIVERIKKRREKQARSLFGSDTEGNVDAA